MTREETEVWSDYAYRQHAEAEIREAADRLYHLLAMNEAQTNPRRKVPTDTVVALENPPEEPSAPACKAFVAVGGSAHLVEALFQVLLKERPELRAPIQDALDSMYKIMR